MGVANAMGKELAKAVNAVADIGDKTSDTTEKLSEFLSRVFGTVPEDASGFLGGDWLRHVRIRNLRKLAQRTDEIIRERKIENATEAVSPSVATPLLRAAQNESREELQELWARFLANGMDPKRSKSVRVSIIKTVEQFDPLDALLLEFLHTLFPLVDRDQWPTAIPRWMKNNGLSASEYEATVHHLLRLDCIRVVDQSYLSEQKQKISIPALQPWGIAVLRACEP